MVEAAQAKTAGAFAGTVNPENEWRLATPSPADWKHDVRPGTAKGKYFMLSVDNHLMPPPTLFRERLPAEYRDRVPRVEVKDGMKFMLFEDQPPAPLLDIPLSGEDALRTKRGTDLSVFDDHGDQVGLARIEDQARDGVDGEVVFPNGLALAMWASKDPSFVHAQCQVWNDWAWEVCGPYKKNCNPAAGLAPAEVAASVKEIERIAKLGFRVVNLPCKPFWGPNDITKPNYNSSTYDPIWAAIQEHDLAITYHIATGMDPRGARGAGGAIINFVVHALAPTIEPIVNMCSSGVFERFPKLRVATIEANAGWVPWMLQAMDEAYKKHHMWVYPKLKMLPSEAYRQNCFASFGEDEAAVEMVETHGLQDNFMWASDYPHHEGSWPHSAEAIERTLGNLTSEETRVKLLGGNAARAFGFDIPQEYVNR